MLRISSFVFCRERKFRTHVHDLRAFGACQQEVDNKIVAHNLSRSAFYLLSGILLSHKNYGYVGIVIKLIIITFTQY